METTLIIIVAIIPVWLIVAFLMSKEMSIERTIIINKPRNQVFEFLKLTKNQDQFSVWNRTDPEMKKEYRGTDGTVGFVYSWNSSTNKNVGAGEQETTHIEENKKIEYEVRFIRPMQQVAKCAFVLKAVTPSQTLVQWAFYGHTHYPLNVLKFVFAKMLGRDLEKSLKDLKVLLEKI